MFQHASFFISVFRYPCRAYSPEKTGCGFITKALKARRQGMPGFILYSLN